ncbi:MAG TPA: hypothetical protein VG867_00610 [Rhizomicrobium sp.]|nr:hypothetical protein [Rhizomicrobium sp.]
MPDISGLLRWRIDGVETDANAPRVEAHPMFAKAARTIAINALESGERDKTLASIAKDAGRYVVAMWSMYLHVSGGLTLPRLKEICAASGFLSPGRARAMLLFMRYLDYVEPSGRERYGTPQRYVPTEGFRTAWRAHLQTMLDAAAILEPAVQDVIDNMGDDRVMDCVARRQGEGLLALSQIRDRETALIRVFLHRHAGANLIFTLVAEGDGSDFPPRGALPFSTARFAERFGVSRIHVRRILDAALREDFVEIPNDGAIAFTQKARDELRASYAMQLSQLLASAADAAAELPPRDLAAAS